jgi:hypothetical protein
MNENICASESEMPLNVNKSWTQEVPVAFENVGSKVLRVEAALLVMLILPE